MANKKNNDMKDWQSKKTFAEICEDPQARALVIDRIRRNDFEEFQEYFLNGNNTCLYMRDKVFKVFEEITEALNTYYSVGEVKYYWLNDIDVVGKSIDYSAYIYRDGYWQIDSDWLIHNRQGGFDPTADPDDIYGFGCTDIMDTIEEITKEEAMARVRKESK